ncbi:MAG: hypothetical protein CL927_06915 [Deltaproteobacteria bacterium]|nr:hypothetical protein [Deltaproteobacteria bacterium]HCH63474.1 hypothetical protein [Deltaproteobacteria bacterium]
MLLFGGLLASTGCHKRYQRHADDLGHVKVVVRDPGIATVQTGDSDIAEPETLTEAAIETASEVATIVLASKAQKKLNRGTSAAETRAAMATGLLQSVDNEALPYKVGEKGRSRLIISIENYGLDASTGVPTAFMNTWTSIVNKQGKVVYRATEICRRSIGPDAQIPFDTVDELMAIHALSELGPKRMGKVLEQLTQTCAEEIATELVTHL